MKDNHGNTALHLAVQKRDQTIFSYLLGNKYVELNHINEEGYTPLDLASKIKTEHPFASRQVCRELSKFRLNDKKMREWLTFAFLFSFCGTEPD